ncbi:MAG: hypothetical protein EBZ98_00345 [Actinobacteria bacterium]|nr:hypothetical protein [Acidimicrobiia bacterium]NDE20097.1 hypothetical protein [Actinomycetota bacterium]NDG10241.1 hypothetical protein [Actinomycetota bacterium]
MKRSSEAATGAKVLDSWWNPASAMRSGADCRGMFVPRVVILVQPALTRAYRDVIEFVVTARGQR